MTAPTIEEPDCADVASDLVWINPDVVEYGPTGPSGRVVVSVVEAIQSSGILPPSASNAELMTESARIPVVFRFRDEEFRLELDDGTWYLTHPRWSLVGAGASPELAYADLIQEAIALAPVYMNIPAQAMDDEALRLTEFLSNFA